MPHLVGATKHSFVLGRDSSDDITLTEEVIHSVRNKKGKLGWMGIKLDLEKTKVR